MTGRDLAGTLTGTLSGTLSGLTTTVRVLGRAGVIRPYGPRTLANIGLVVARWGTGPAGGFATLAARSPHQVGIVDELGELTWGELHRRSNSLARALSERGVREGDSVAVMCRNHRGFIDASVAVAKLGADICTCPPAVIDSLFKHPLTDIGLERFLKDWEKAQQK